MGRPAQLPLALTPITCRRAGRIESRPVPGGHRNRAGNVLSQGADGEYQSSVRLLAIQFIALSQAWVALVTGKTRKRVYWQRV